VKYTAHYDISIKHLGFNSVCGLEAEFQPGNRLRGIRNHPAASGNPLTVRAGVHLCKISGERNYNLVLDPQFYAIENQSYLSAPGFEQSFGKKAVRPDSIIANLSSPTDHTGRPLAFKRGFDSYSPLYYTGYPNSTDTFPQGFHLMPLTGDFRFVPTRQGRYLLKTRYTAHTKGKVLLYGEREYLLSVLTSTGKSAPYLTGRDFSSHYSYDNFRMMHCFGQSKTHTFLALDNDSQKIGIQWYIDPGLSRYVSLRQGGDTLAVVANWDTLTLSSNPMRITLMLNDSGCQLGTQGSYTLLFYNNKTPKTSAKLSFEGNRTIRLRALGHDGFKTDRYEWKFLGMRLTGADTLAQVKVPGDYGYRLVSLGLGGCHDTIYGNYSTPNFPYILINNSKKKYCLGDSIGLTATFHHATTAPDLYWNEQHLGARFDIVLFHDTQIVVVAIFKDSSTSHDTLYIHALDNPVPAISGLGHHCPGNLLRLSSAIPTRLDSARATVEWLFNQQLVSDSLSCLISGEGTVNLTVRYINGCEQNTSSYIPYDISYDPGRYPDKSCPQQPLLLEIAGYHGFEHFWYLYDSLVHQGSATYQLPRTTKNTKVLVRTTYDESMVSCTFWDSLPITILPVTMPTLLSDTVFCTNDSTIDLLSQDFIQPNSGTWRALDNEKLLEQGRYLSPGKSGLNGGAVSLEYTTVHPISSCRNLRVVDMEIRPVIQPQYVSDSIKLCIGGSDILLNNAAYAIPSNGLWEGPGTYADSSSHYFSPSLVGINSSNLIHYQYRSGNGCTATIPVTVTVNLKPNPVAKVRSSYAPRTLDFYDQRDTNDCKVDIWLWDFNDIYGLKCTLDQVVDSTGELYCRYASVQNPVHRYAHSGIYSVKLVVQDSKTGIKDSAIKSNYIFLLSSQHEPPPAIRFSFYPNPVHGQVQFSQSAAVAKSYTVHSLLGNKLLGGKIAGTEQLMVFPEGWHGPVAISLFDKDQNTLGVHYVLLL
jgi:hypothetical protein